jgi:hypothetical protein
MKLRKVDVAIIATGGGLMTPLVMNWASDSAPVLALIGVVLVAGIVIVRTSMNLGKPEIAPTTVPAPVQVGHVAYGRNRTQDVFPVETHPPKHCWPVERWLWFWNNPNHGWMLFWCAAVIVFPLDDMVPIGITWLDDIAAMVLFVKHANDLYQLKWGKAPAQMLAEKAAGLVATVQAHDTAGYPSALSQHRVHAKSPR